MKRKILAALAAVGLAAGAQAAVVDFGLAASSGDNWTNLSQVVETDGSITFTKAQDGVTFDLNVAGVTDYTGTPVDQGVAFFANGAGGGVIGNQSDTRISNGVDDGTTDDEYLVFTLSVSGTPLTALSLDHVQIRYDANADDQLTWVDQNGTAQIATGLGSGYDYTALNTLTGLSLANVGSWSLAAGSTENGTLPGEDKGIMALGQVSFEYTVIPEPATLSLLAVTGGGLLYFRRRRML